MTKNTSAAVADSFDSVSDRVAPVRIFHWDFNHLALLALAEIVVIVLAFYAALTVRFPDATFAQWPLFWLHTAIIAAMVFLGMACMGLYQLRQRTRFTGVLARLLIALVIAEAGLGLLFYLFPALFIGRGVLLFFGAFSMMGLMITRYAFQKLADEDIFKRRVLVWGAGSRAAIIGTRLRRRVDQRGFKIVGYVRAPGDHPDVACAQLVQPEMSLVKFALRNRVEEIVVAMDDRRSGFPEAELMECRLRGIQVNEILTFLERESGRMSIELAQPSWFIYSPGFRCDMLRLASKRLFDIAISVAVLLVTMPIALLAALAIFLEDRGPIFYRQIRTGQHGRDFPVLKFRSMRVDAEAGGKAVWASQNDPRVTRVGAFIRKVRIDELPQLLNVLAGHMSFVGPRPERPSFVKELTEAIPFYPERHFVKPGLTGWAQVRYSYGSSVADAREKLGYDLYYVKNHSLVFDLMVLLLTVEIVLFRVGSR
jgi:sugar transferase (PEP-CTERM system associated)